MPKGIGKYTCSSASALETMGIIAMIAGILGGVVLAFISLTSMSAIGLVLGAIVVILGLFLSFLSNCIAIITENQYRQAIRLMQNDQI